MTSGSEFAPEAGRRVRFEAVFAAVYEPLQRYLRRRTDASTADDVLGDALLVLWRRLDDIPADAPLAWAYGVARGCLANHLRSAARQERLVHRLASIPQSAPNHDDALDDAMGSLPDSDQELLRLWAWEQLPPREIAVVLGISANAASIRLHRAIAKLRTQLIGKDKSSIGHLGDRQREEDPR